jgi:natural product precursor
MKTKRSENQQNLKKLFLNKETLVLLNKTQMTTLLGGNNAIHGDTVIVQGGPKTTC